MIEKHNITSDLPAAFFQPLSRSGRVGRGGWGDLELALVTQKVNLRKEVADGTNCNRNGTVRLSYMLGLDISFSYFPVCSDTGLGTSEYQFPKGRNFV